MSKSVTESLAEWIVSADYDQIPDADKGIENVKERIVDTLGVQFAGMAVPTGRIATEWVRAQGAKPESTVVGQGFKTTASYATLLNAAAGHALEFDDIALFSGHYANPMTAAGLAVGEKLGASGRDVILAWMVGYEVIAQTAKPCASSKGNTLLFKGWFNQGFQPCLGAAALAAKLMGLDVRQTRRALGIAAGSAAGLMKNRGSDAKSLTAGNAAMHGVMAAELAALGFTGNEDILDGDIGFARLVGAEGVSPEVVLEGLGDWQMATLGSTLRLNASCAAGHWGMDALQEIVERRPTDPAEIDRIEATIPGFLTEMLPYHLPQTGLEAKYSFEYDLVTIALHGRGGLHQFSDEAVRSPEAQELMQRVTIVPMGTDMTDAPLESRVTVTLKSGEKLEGTANVSHGRPEDPLSKAEVLGKFHECAAGLLSEAQRNRVLDLVGRLDSLGNVSELADAVGAVER